NLFYCWSAIDCLIPLSSRLVYLTDNPSLTAALFSPYLYRRVFPAIMAPFYLFLPFCVCAVIVRNYSLTKEHDQRRRIKWVVYGSVVAFLPTLTNMIIVGVLNPTSPGGPARGAPGGLSATLNWFRLMDLTADLALVFIPIAFSYAITKHRVLDINV